MVEPCVWVPEPTNGCFPAVFAYALHLLPVTRVAPRRRAAGLGCVGSVLPPHACPAAPRSVVLSEEPGFLVGLWQGSRRAGFMPELQGSDGLTSSAPLTSNHFLPSPGWVCCFSFSCSSEPGLKCAVLGITNRTRPLGDTRGPRSRVGRFSTTKPTKARQKQ